MTRTETYSAMLDRLARKYGDRFDPSDLDPRFIPFYGTDHRVKVDDGWYTGPITGTIGLTTGWRPAFLLMRRRDSIGSPHVLTSDVRFLAVKYAGSRRYVEVGEDR